MKSAIALALALIAVIVIAPIALALALIMVNAILESIAAIDWALLVKLILGSLAVVGLAACWIGLRRPAKPS